VEAQWLRFAAHHEPDPLNTAASRLEFLAVALRFIHERGEAAPRSLEELRENLQRRRFSVTRTSHGLTSVFRARDEELFEYERDNGITSLFQILAAARDDLPPRIAAPGLNPTPTLVWRRDSDGQLAQDIEYR
jgi:HAMP domain-containing protein